jgi:serine/threonine-protein kinase HipA
MRKLDVRFTRDPASSFLVGQLAEAEHRVYFEYAPDMLERGLWLSPLKLPLEGGLHEHTDREFGPLPGLFDDSLPDGWGLLLMDRHFRKAGLEPAGVSCLDRLAFLGTRTMGALTYHPPVDLEDAGRGMFDLQALADQSRRILAGSSEDVLPDLLRAGGSPAGARPKVLVGLRGEEILSGEDDLPDGYEHWIVKFFAKDDSPDTGAVEYAYSLMAREAGIDMPPCRVFETIDGDRFFGARRFDRRGNRRFHVHSFGNLIHANFRIPSCDYGQLLKVTSILTRNHQDVLRCYRRMVFNVLAHNRDDHVKNFAFVMSDDGEWSLSPAYDLTYSTGPGGEHSMTVAGEGRDPGRGDLLRLADPAGISPKAAGAIIDEVTAGVHRWPDHANRAAVTPDSRRRIAGVLGCP